MYRGVLYIIYKFTLFYTHRLNGKFLRDRTKRYKVIDHFELKKKLAQRDCILMKSLNAFKCIMNNLFHALIN